MGVYNNGAVAGAHNAELNAWSTLSLNCDYNFGGIPGNIIIGGNVGIGTQNPQGKLDVHGSIYYYNSLVHSDLFWKKDCFFKET